MDRLRQLFNAILAFFGRRAPQPPDQSAEEIGDRPPATDVSAYGIRIEPAKVTPGQPHWRAVRVRHLTPEENHGNHHLFLDVFAPTLSGDADPMGDRVFGARLKVTWKGGTAIVSVDKPLGEPGANFPMWKSQMCTVEALGLPGQELPSDRVTGMHIRHPDEAPGNTWGHHSFAITFVRTEVLQPGQVEDQRVTRYILFGPAEQPATAVNLLLAQEYLLACHPAFGFSPAEARGAGAVTIIGDAQAVSRQIEAELAAGDARVRRIAGSVAEVAAALAAQLRADRPVA